MSTRRTILAVTLDVQSFWSDEAATITLLRRPFGGMLGGIVDAESTPPLYYVVAWLWTQVAGTGEVGARSLSAVISAGTVPVVAALAARLVPAPVAARAAIFAAVLTAVSPLTVWYGQEARAYALLMLLVAASTLALLRALDEPSRGRLAAWTALAVASMWTHHFALFVVVGQGLWLLWVVRARAVTAVAGAAAGALALTPLLLHQRDAGRASFIAEESLGRRLAQLPKQVLVGYDAPAEALLLVVGLLACVVAAAGLVPRLTGRADRAPAVVLSVGTVGVALPLLAVLVGQDFLLTRNVIGVLPLALAVLGAGAASWRPRRAIGTAAVGALVGAGLFCAAAVATDGAYQRDDFRDAVAAATRGPAGGRLVVADAPGRVPLLLYLGRGTRIVTPGELRTVRIIDVVKPAGARPGGPRQTPAIPDGLVPPGFAPQGSDTGDTWAVRRFAAPAGLQVDPEALLALDPERDAIVLYRDR